LHDFLKKKAPLLESERLIFKPLGLEHLSSAYVDWMNDRDVVKYLESGGDYNFEMLKDFLGGVQDEEVLFWAIHLKSNNKHIGNIKIDPVWMRHMICEFSILMGDKMEWGKGYAKEASLRIIDFCFKELNIRKINLGVVENNTVAVKLYTNLGFSIEGVYIDHGIYDGVFSNVLRMALFNKNYLEGRM